MLVVKLSSQLINTPVFAPASVNVTGCDAALISDVPQSPLDAATHVVSALSWKLITASVVASESIVSPFRSIVKSPAGEMSPTLTASNL
jgi:hypothetical protein